MKNLLIIALAFVAVSCSNAVEITPYFDYTFELTTVQTSDPFEAKQNFTRVDTLTFQMCEGEANYYVYQSSLPIHGETPTCKILVTRKCRIIKAD